MLKREKWDDIRQIELQECSALGSYSDERRLLRQARAHINAFGLDCQRDRLYPTSTVGLEDLVQRSQGDLKDRGRVPLLLLLEGETRRRDLVLRLDVLELL